MKFSFLILIALLSVYSCGPSTKTPPGVLGQDKMVEILIEIHLLEGKIEQLHLSPDSARQVYNAFEKQVFENHSVSEKTYRDSFSWYFNNVRAIENIYGRVVDSLLVRQQSKNLLN